MTHSVRVPSLPTLLRVDRNSITHVSNRPDGISFGLSGECPRLWFSSQHHQPNSPIPTQVRELCISDNLHRASCRSGWRLIKFSMGARRILSSGIQRIQPWRYCGLPHMGQCTVLERQSKWASIHYFCWWNLQVLVPYAVDAQQKKGTATASSWGAWFSIQDGTFLICHLPYPVLEREGLSMQSTPSRYAPRTSVLTCSNLVTASEERFGKR